MAQTRRSFLNSALALLLAGGPGRAWPKPAESGGLAQAVAQASGGREPVDSAQVSLEAPAIAEDGALVPVTVDSALPGVESIWLFVEKNPVPLAARVDFAGPLEPFLSLRVKMNESCDLVALVKAGEDYFSARRAVKVVTGGCG